MLNELTPLGKMAGIRQIVTGLDRPYFVVEDGSIWGMNSERSIYQVESAKDILLVDHLQRTPLTLNKAGQIHLWSNQFETCQMLHIPFSVQDVVVGESHLLLLSEDDGLYTLQFEPQWEPRHGKYQVQSIQPLQLEAVQWAGEEIKQIKTLHANNYTFFVLTNDGQVFYAEEGEANSWVFKLIDGLPSINQVAAQYFVRYTGESTPAWVLDANGNVHEIVVEKSRDEDAKSNELRITINTNQEDNMAIVSGRLRVTNGGDVFEHGMNSIPTDRRTLPSPARLVSSNYDYKIEGPGSHYHVIVTEDDQIWTMGHNPFGTFYPKPDVVVIPAE